MRGETSIVRLRPATGVDYDFARRVHHGGMRWIAERLFGPWDAAAQDEKFKRQFVLDEVRIIVAGDGASCRHEMNPVVLLHGQRE